MSLSFRNQSASRVCVAHRRAGFLRVAAVVLSVIAVVVFGANYVASAAPSPSCPKLFVLGVQGTGQSSDNAATDTDTGFLSTVMQPLLTMAGSLVKRAYVPYDAGFGGAVAGGQDPYEQSVSQAKARLGSMAQQELSECPSTKLAVVGYSQGAHAVSMWAQDVAAGHSPISPDRVAAVALFGDPTRKQGSGVFEGSDSDRPAPVPQTSGQSVSQLPPVTTPAPSGEGIGPVQDVSGSYGSLTGRVGSWCTSGDLACDAPDNAPLMHVVTNVAGQSELNPDDPVAALSTIGEAVALTAVKTAVPVINDDVQAPDNTLDSLSYEPQESISQRLATASDPRTPLPGAQDTISAILKVGVIGFNAVKSVVTQTFTPSTIATLAAVGLANPGAALGLLGTRFASAVVDLVPPATGDRLVNEAFTALQQNVSDNSDLLNITNLLKYSQAAQMHGSYGSVPATATGDSPVTFVAKWLAAAAFDVAGKVLALGDTNGDLPIDSGSWLGSGSDSDTTTDPTNSSTQPGTMTIPDLGGDSAEDTTPPMQGSPSTGMAFNPFQTPSASSTAPSPASGSATPATTPAG
ncbi:MAG: cutinase family protein [Gordonia polyisoprenivorans]|nr:cutinase family protein [Gordonia polyisoprenivorans]